MRAFPALCTLLCLLFASISPVFADGMGDPYEYMLRTALICNEESQLTEQFEVVKRTGNSYPDELVNGCRWFDAQQSSNSILEHEERIDGLIVTRQDLRPYSIGGMSCTIARITANGLNGYVCLNPKKDQEASLENRPHGRFFF